MTSVNKLFRILTVALALTGAVVAQTEAAIISVSPVSQGGNIGDSITADIIVSGLAADESVGGVSFLLSFNDSVLSGTSFVIDPDDKMGAELDLSFGFTGGAGSPLDVFFLADVLLDHDDLKALQGAGFRVATITFQAMANGFSGLVLSATGLSGEFLSNADGLTPIPTQAVNGSVCIGGTCPVAPEPGLIALLGAGLSAIAVRRRARPRV
jgi:hypothetical protein